MDITCLVHATLYGYMGLLRFLFSSSRFGVRLNGDEHEDGKEMLIPPHQPVGSLTWSRRRKLQLSLVLLGGLVLLFTITLLAGHRYVAVPSSFEHGWSTEIGTTTSDATVPNK